MDYQKLVDGIITATCVLLDGLHEADETMYADKNEFYLKHPELKARK